MTVSLNFWFYPAWHEKDDQENWKDLVPDAVDQLLVKQEVETLIAESFHPTKVSQWEKGNRLRFPSLCGLNFGRFFIYDPPG